MGQGDRGNGGAGLAGPGGEVEGWRGLGDGLKGIGQGDRRDRGQWVWSGVKG